ncbi:MAG: OmpH family outer membrane protein [Parvibaculaceae bacterium]
MKFHRIAARFMGALAAASLLVAAPLSAASADTNILVVNTDVLFAQSKVGKSLDSQIEAAGAKLKADFQKAGDSLRAEGKKLGDQRGLLKEEDFANKARAFEQKQSDTQRSFQEKEQNMQLGVNYAKIQIQKAIGPLIAGVVSANGGGVLMDKNAVVYGGKDVTGDLVKALDGKMSTVKFTPMSKADFQKAVAK